MDIGCNINDAALLRNLAEDVPDMAASVRRRLRELADLIEAREASARPEVPALHEGMREVPCAVRDDGWLYIPHASGQWVTAAKLQPFSLAIIQHWKAEQRTRGVPATADASAWWALVMGAAACIEDAANCLRDPDAKKQADGAAKHYRDAAQKLMAAPGVAPCEGGQR